MCLRRLFNFFFSKYSMFVTMSIQVLGTVGRSVWLEFRLLPKKYLLVYYQESSNITLIFRYMKYEYRKRYISCFLEIFLFFVNYYDVLAILCSLWYYRLFSSVPYCVVLFLCIIILPTIFFSKLITGTVPVRTSFE